MKKSIEIDKIQVNIHLLKLDCKLSEAQCTIPFLFPASVVAIINITAFQMKIIGFL